MIDLLDFVTASDDLERMANAIEHAGESVSDEVRHALVVAITRQFEEISEITRGIDSESTLEDHSKTLEKLAPIARVSSEVVATALQAVKNRMAEIAEEVVEEQAPSVTGTAQQETDTFDDQALRDLFTSLALA